MYLIDSAEVVLTIALTLGAGALVFWFLLRFAAAKNTPAVRKTICVLLLVIGVVEIVRIALWEPVWMDYLRHGLALVTIVLIAADALVYGTTVARASVGIGSIALFAGTLYRTIVLFYPASATARWLATTAETMVVLMPWVLAAVVTRRYMDDVFALFGAAMALVFSTAAVITIAPAVHLITAQAMGFRYALLPSVHVLTTGALFYFLIRSFRSDELPRQVPWAYIWLAGCGIQMVLPHVQMGALTALAVLAWAPPLALPNRTRRWRFDETGTVLQPKEQALDAPLTSGGSAE
jgi:hypothetical protein